MFPGDLARVAAPPPAGSYGRGGNAVKTTLVLLLSAAVLFSGVRVVLAQHQARQVFGEIQRLKNDRDWLNEEWRRLRLEQGVWTVEDRIESIAANDLNMQAPTAAATVFLLP